MWKTFKNPTLQILNPQSDTASWKKGVKVIFDIDTEDFSKSELTNSKLVK